MVGSCMFCMHVACFVGGDWWLLGSVQSASRQLPCGNSLAACFACSAFTIDLDIHMQRGGGSRSATMSSSSTVMYDSATTASRPASRSTTWWLQTGAAALLQAEEAAEGGGLDDHVNDRGGGAWGLLCGCGPCGRGISAVVQFSSNSIDVDSCDAGTAPSRRRVLCACTTRRKMCEESW